MKMIYIPLTHCGMQFDHGSDMHVGPFNSGRSWALKYVSDRSFNGNKCDQGDPRELKLITKIHTFSLKTFKDLLE